MSVGFLFLSISLSRSLCVCMCLTRRYVHFATVLLVGPCDEDAKKMQRHTGTEADPNNLIVFKLVAKYGC